LVASSSAGKAVSSGVTFKTSAPRKPLSFGVAVKPRADLTAPFTFRVTGRLGLPAGLSAAVGCKGKVMLLATVGKASAGRARATIGKRCGYSLRVTFKSSGLPSHGRARLVVAFVGTPVLAKSKSRAVVVKFGGSGTTSSNSAAPAMSGAPGTARGSG
jgi:hypothetical protein